MPKYTNVLGLPEPYVKLVTTDDYTRGKSDISVTALTGPHRVFLLYEKHKDEVVVDVADLTWMFFGKIAHGFLEKADTSALTEKRLYAELMGITFSGQFDRFHLESGTLCDYKTHSCYKYKDGGVPEDLETQLNCYAYLLRENDYVVKSLKVMAFLKDWSPSRRMQDPSLPDHSMVYRDVPLWDSQKTMEYLIERIEAFQAAREKLPLCTAEERWVKDEKWAVMKPGRKSAVRLLDSKDAAQSYIETQAVPGAHIQYRQGKNIRCNDYCPVKDFCDQYSALYATEIGFDLKKEIKLGS